MIHIFCGYAQKRTPDIVRHKKGSFRMSCGGKTGPDKRGKGNGKSKADTCRHEGSFVE